MTENEETPSAEEQHFADNGLEVPTRPYILIELKEVIPDFERHGVEMEFNIAAGNGIRPEIIPAMLYFALRSITEGELTEVKPGDPLYSDEIDTFVGPGRPERQVDTLDDLSDLL